MSNPAAGDRWRLLPTRRHERRIHCRPRQAERMGTPAGYAGVCQAAQGARRLHRVSGCRRILAPVIDRRSCRWRSRRPWRCAGHRSMADPLPVPRPGPPGWHESRPAVRCARNHVKGATPRAGRWSSILIVRLHRSALNGEVIRERTCCRSRTNLSGYDETAVEEQRRALPRDGLGHRRLACQMLAEERRR